MAVSYAEVEKILASAGDRYLLLLLTEVNTSSPKVKPGIPALSMKVLDVLTDRGGPLDEGLMNWAKQRPSRVQYHRLSLDRSDAKTLVRLGVSWLPQVRLVRRDRVLFRSSVSIGDNGEFLAQDVGGRSFKRRVDPSADGYTNMMAALSAEVDR